MSALGLVGAYIHSATKLSRISTGHLVTVTIPSAESAAKGKIKPKVPMHSASFATLLQRIGVMGPGLRR